MRFVELLVTDVVEESAAVRTEWIHRDHIESIEAWAADDEGAAGAPLWLELTLTSGRIRYVPVGEISGGGLVVAAGRAVRSLLEEGQLPVAATR